MTFSFDFLELANTVVHDVKTGPNFRHVARKTGLKRGRVRWNPDFDRYTYGNLNKETKLTIVAEKSHKAIYRLSYVFGSYSSLTQVIDD